jgi:hypothetical protein
MRPNWFRRLCLIGALLALGVVVLGAWVRLSHAGLGCPDWPGCYGHLTVGDAVENAAAANAAHPERPLEADKAMKEMVHRYFASTLGLLIVLAAVLALRNRRDPAQPVRLPAALVLLVVLDLLLVVKGVLAVLGYNFLQHLEIQNFPLEHQDLQEHIMLPVVVVVQEDIVQAISVELVDLVVVVLEHQQVEVHHPLLLLVKQTLVVAAVEVKYPVLT